MMKTRLDNGIINHVGAFYAKNDTHMSWSIGPSVVYDKTRQDTDVTDHTSVVHVENKTKLSLSIGLSVVCDEN